MDSLTVMHNVPVKVVMTESFRLQVVEQVRSSLAELDQESARLNEFMSQAAEADFRQRLEGELQRPWQEGEHRLSRAVFIGRHLDEAALTAGFESCIAKA